MDQKRKIIGKFYYFFENKFIFIFISLFFVIVYGNHLLVNFDSSISNNGLYVFFDNQVRNSLNEMQSSLFSIAAIFIGIYFTVFTLLGSIKVDSIFTFLSDVAFKNLIKFIRNAFIAAFSYLLLVMYLEFAYSSFVNIPFFLILLKATIVLYMFSTALRFGVILYVAFSRDLKDIQRKIEVEKEKKRKLEDLEVRLNVFLEDFEIRRDKQKADELSKKLRE